MGGQETRGYPVQMSGDAGRGRDLIQFYGCGSCHTIPGVYTARGTVGPPLMSFAERTMIAGEVPNSPANLVRWITNPKANESGTAMPNLGVTNNDAHDLAAYLYTLR
jgi:cytochrome c1